QYDEFVKNFFKVQQIGFVPIFEYRWKLLLEKYNNVNVVNYLQRLYNNKESWAKAFVLKLFTAGMSSTSRVESYNSKLKRLIFNSNTTILELVDKLTACVLEEDKKTDYALFRASIPKAALVATASTILPNVCEMLRKHLTVEILKIQEDQIKQSLQYHAVIVTQSELQRYHASRWFNKTSNNSEQEPFLIAQKFETEQSVKISCRNSVPYLNALVQDTTYEVQNRNRKIVDERKLYREAWGKARAALMVAVRRYDYNFIKILDKYLDNCQEEISSNSDSNSNDSEIDSNNEVESDSISKKGMIDPKELVNPRKRKGKGWPKGTDRMRRANEPPKRAKRKLHCKICGGVGHNRATCSQRQK
ncbi:167_t:CDS:2, partial [Racocetra fulgida]